MSLIALIIYLSELAFIGIVLWYVVEQLTAMPSRMRLIAQSLLALILILAAVQAVIFGSGYHGPIEPIVPPGSTGLQR